MTTTTMMTNYPIDDVVAPLREFPNLLRLPFVELLRLLLLLQQVLLLLIAS